MESAKELFTIFRLRPLARREALWGLAFLTPWIIGFLAFTLFPMIATLGFTFSNITLTQEEPLQFVGLQNYAHLFRDGQLWDSLGATVKFGLLALPVGSGTCSTSSHESVVPLVVRNRPELPDWLGIVAPELPCSST